MKIPFMPGVFSVKKTIIFIAAIVVSQVTHAAKWYVDTAGNNSYNGKSATFVSGNIGPLRTLAAAYDSAAVADTIFMGNGYFAEHFYMSTKDIYIAVSKTIIKAVSLDGAGAACIVIGSASNVLTIKDTLNFNNSVLYTSTSNALLQLAPGCIQTGGNSSSFVDGKYAIGVSTGPADIVFHLGDNNNTDYRKVRLTFSKTGTDTVYIDNRMNYGAAPVSGSIPAGIRNISNIRYFKLGANSYTSASDFVLEPDYDFQNIDDEAGDANGLRLVLHKGTGNWISLDGDGTADDAGTLQNTSPADTLAFFTYANDSLGHNALGSDEVFAVLPPLFKACLGQPINFSDSSVSLRFPIDSFFWDFGVALLSSDTSSQQAPSYTYADTGNYTVKLKVFSSGGYQDSTTAMVRINALPSVNFGFTEVCKGALTRFTDSSKVNAPSSIASRNWSYGDGGTGTGSPVNYPYAADGVYNVRLIVTTNDGCSDSTDKPVRVFAKPTANFLPPASCINDSAVFRRIRNTNPPENQVSYAWYINGVFHKTDTLTKYLFTVPGSQSAKLIATAANGCIDSVTKTFNLFNLPVPNFTAPVVCLNDSAYFLRIRNTVPPESTLTWSWKVDGVPASTDTAFKYKFTLAGPHSVKLIGRSIQGCKDSITKNITVQNLPVPNFVTSDICLSDTARFRRIANTIPPDNQINWSWKADGSPLAGDTAAKIRFATIGSHTITLYGVSVFGCKDSITKTLTAYGLPSVGFVLDPSVAGNTQTQCLKGNKFTSFPTLSTTQAQTITGATWKWGDGTTDLLKDSVHSYAAVGNYTVTLVATTNRGCTDSASNTYRVRGTLSLNFKKSGSCVPDSILFSDSAVAASSAIASRMWKVNGANASAVSPAKIFFNGTGPYTVSYTITTAEGCTDSISKTVSFTTYPNLTFNFTGTSPFCEGDSLKVRANGGTNIVWLNDNDTNRTKVFKSAIRYRVRAYNGTTCFVEDDDTVLVFPKIAVKAFSDTTIFRGSSALLRATGASTYSWSPATALNTATGPQVRSSTLQTRNYVVTGTDANGCSDQDTVTVTVIDPVFTRIPNIISPNGDGDNDVWDVKELRDLDLYDLTIVDYAGKVVYESSNYQNDWGAVDKSNNRLPDGIYYYLLHHRGNHSELKGFIHVIR